MATEQNRDRLVDMVSKDDDASLRPPTLAAFVGQDRARTHLEIVLRAAQSRSEVLDHVLFYGPPGLGKTTLAGIVANEMGTAFRPVMAPSIQRAADLAGVLLTLSRGDVLFIDEIHRLPPQIEEILYSAMEDFRLNIMVGEAGRTVAMGLDIAPFTLVGATTRSGMLSRPLRERFGIDVRLDLYPSEDLAGIVVRSAGILGLGLDAGVALAIGQRARGTPRLANRILRRVRDYAAHAGCARVDAETAEAAFRWLELDAEGLDELDRRYLNLLKNRYRNRPVGLKTIAAALGEDSDTIEYEVEPWLVMRGLVGAHAEGARGGAGPGESAQRTLPLLA